MDKLSSIQKVLDSDSFEQMIDKLNEVIRYCDKLTQSINNAYKQTSGNAADIVSVKEQINSIQNDIKAINVAIKNIETPAEVTQEEMLVYTNELYQS